MSFTLVRVDDRLIHGQVVLFWSKVREGDGIILVVDDVLGQDKFLKSVFKNAGKQMNKNVYIFTLEQALKKVPEAQQSNKKYFLISKSISFLADLKRSGVDLGNEIIIGNTSNRSETIKMYNNVYFSKQEIMDTKYLNSEGMDITFQLTPNEKGLKFKDSK